MSEPSTSAATAERATPRSLSFEERAQQFCAAFIAAEPSQRYVLGRGDYANSVADLLPIAGFVDDYTDAVEHAGRPIVRSGDLSPGAMVVVASMLRPRSALQTLAGSGVEALDYYAVQRFSGLALKEITFWPRFVDDYATNKGRYDAVRARLGDAESVETFDRLIEFRLTQDLCVMSDFRYDIVNQYFEDFLELARSGESFVDIGSYDGFTSLEFARRAPEFRHITAFEPAVDNVELVRENLASLGHERVTVHNCGLSDEQRSVSFSVGQGSSNRMADTGPTVVRLERLDDIELTDATFLKMDIEGGEEAALLGGLATIAKHRPRLAISAYHRAMDFWLIPSLVDRAGVDYRLEMRHYTEGIDETVLFFLPR